MNRTLFLCVLLSGCGGSAFEAGLLAPDGGPSSLTEAGPLPDHLLPFAPPPDARTHPNFDGGAEIGIEASTAPEATPPADAGTPPAEAAAAPDAPLPGDEPPPPPPPKDAGGGPEASACSPAPAETLPCGSAHIAAPGLYCHATAVNLSLGQWSYSPEATPPECQCTGAFNCACLETAGLCTGQVFHCTDLDGGGPSPWCS